MNKIGIIGGTFDPIHNAHISLAESAYRELGLSKVMFIPAYIPPHKTEQMITNESHRMKMIELAIQPFAYFELSDIEIELQGSSYTARTLSELHKNTNDTLVFILGSDSYMYLDQWYHPEIIFEKAEIACGIRTGTDLGAFQKKLKQYENDYNGISHVLKMPLLDISSTMIRDSINHNKDIEQYVPKSVISYINEHKIYT